MESKATLLELDDLFAAPPPGGGGGAVLVAVVVLEEMEEVLRRGLVSEVVEEVALLFLALVVRRAAVGLGAVDVVEALGADAPSSSIGSNVRKVYSECHVPTETSNHQ